MLCSIISVTLIFMRVGENVHSTSKLPLLLPDSCLVAVSLRAIEPVPGGREARGCVLK